MKFFEHVYRSLWDIEWLAQAKDMKRRWAYFFLFMFVLTTLTIIPFFFEIPRAMNIAKNALQNETPAFTATFTDGTLVVGELPQPFVLEQHVEGSQGADNVLIYIDTTTSTEVLDAKELATKPNQSVFLVTGDRFETYDSVQKSFQSQSFNSIPNISFSKQSILDFLNTKGTMVLSLILVLSIIIGFVLAVIARLLYLVITSAVVALIVAIARKNGWKYGDIFNLSLSTSMLPSVVLLIAGYIAFRPPFVFSVIFFVLSLSVIFREVKKPEHKKEVEAPKE